MSALGIQVQVEGAKGQIPVDQEERETLPEVGVTLRLLHTEEVPANYTRVLMAVVDQLVGCLMAGRVEPIRCPGELKGLEFEPVLVELDRDGVVKIPVCNRGEFPLVVEVGQVVGTAQTVEVLQGGDPDSVKPDVSVNAKLLSRTGPGHTIQSREDQHQCRCPQEDVNQQEQDEALYCSSRSCC